MADRTFSGFLRRSLDVLAVEASTAYAAVAKTLAERRVSIEVDDERVVVANLSGKLTLLAAGEPCAAQATASRQVLHALLDGELGLTDAILADRVRLSGELDDLVAFHDALLLYFMGAVRSPSFAALSDEFFDSRATASSSERTATRGASE